MLQPKCSFVTREVNQLKANGTLPVLSASLMSTRLKNITTLARAE